MSKIKRPAPKQKRPEDAQKVFSGALFDVYQWEQEMFDGSTATFEQLTRADTVVVIGVTDDQQIVVTEQLQPGWREPQCGVVAGRIESGEEVLVAAAREFREETGYVAREYTSWFSVQPVGKIDWAVYLLIAHGAHRVGKAELDAGEKITTREIAFEEFAELVTSGTFADSELIEPFLRARIDPLRMQELKEIFGIIS